MTVGNGPIKIDADGTLRSGAAIAGRLKIVEFDDTAALSRANTHFVQGGRRDAPTPPRTRRCVPARPLSSRTFGRRSDRRTDRCEPQLREHAEGAPDDVQRHRRPGHHGTGPPRITAAAMSSSPGGDSERGTSMIRAFHTAASGMNAQQANIDNVAHNLANVNTVGFKKSRVEFEDYRVPSRPNRRVRRRRRPRRLPSDSKRASVSARWRPRATSAAATCAPRAARWIWRSRAPGSFRSSCRAETAYTRAGMRFHLNAQGALVTNEGYSVQPQISIPPNATAITISKDGIVSASIPGQTAAQAARHDRTGDLPEPGGSQGRRRQLYPGVQRVGRADDRRARHRLPRHDRASLRRDSNVSVVEEMVNMILGQRAHEANSRS